MRNEERTDATARVSAFRNDTKSHRDVAVPQVGNIEVRRENRTTEQSWSARMEKGQTRSPPLTLTVPYTCNRISNRRRRVH